MFMQDVTTYSINGIHCSACTTLITMELVEAGFDSIELDTEKYTISVPHDLVDNIEAIKDVIASAGDYSITATP